MPRVTSPRVIVLSVVAVVLAVNVFFFGGRLFSWISDSTTSLMTGAVTRIAWVRSIGSTIFKRTDLAARIHELEEENGILLGERSRFAEVEREVVFCRTAAGITTRPVGPSLQAGIFAYDTLSGMRQAIVNRGSDDGVSVGDIVITARGELVGTVRTAFGEHAVIYRTQDVAFETTARVSGGDVAGLVHSDGNGSLVLDLVQKDERVDEGATVFTSGDDGFPAGLIIGTVRSVNNTAATLFQLVRIEPAVPNDVHDSVLIMHP